MVESIFVSLSVIVLITAVISGIIRLFRQPLIIAYIITGIVISPYFLNLLHAVDTFRAFSQIGVALLLFIVGLNLNPKLARDVGWISVLTGLGQVIFTAGIGYYIAQYLGFDFITSLYIAVALTFSSTIIIMKLLSDKGELETLHGRISVGFLLVQDFIAILLLLFASSLGTVGMASFVVRSFITGILLIIVLFFISTTVLNKISSWMAESQELLFLFALAWCFSIASIFAYFNLSIEIGAFIAGVSLSFSPYHYEMSSRIRPLRDFFLIMFFVLLGSQMDFQFISQFIKPTIIFSLFILIGNPLIVFFIMLLFRYTARTSFKAGITVAQISEFSFILITLGVKIGHIPREIISFITLVGIITIAGSTYLIMYSDNIFSTLSKFLLLFQRKKLISDGAKKRTCKILLLGFNRMGSSIYDALRAYKKDLLVIDYDPQIIRKLEQFKIPHRYGDVYDLELLDDISLKKTKIIISTVADYDTDMLILRKIRKEAPSSLYVCVSKNIKHALQLYDAGASYIITPHILGAQYAAHLLKQHGLKKSFLKKEKRKHINQLYKIVLNMYGGKI